MNGKLSYCLSVTFGALALVFLIANVWLINDNHAKQIEVAQRQAELNRAVSLSQINQGLVQALADASTNKEDGLPIHDLLVTQGITLKPQATATAVESTPAKTKKN